MIRPVLAAILAIIFLSLSDGCKPSGPSGDLFQLDSTAPQSIVELTEKLKDDPDNHALFYERSGAWLREHRPDRSLADINQAIKLDSNIAEYYLHRATIYEKSAKMYEAKDDLKKAISLEPEKEDGYLRLSILNLYVKNYDESINNANRAIELNERSVNALFTKAMAFKEMNDTARAISQFRQVILVDENHYDSYIQLGLIYSLYNDERGFPFLDLAIRIDERNPEAYYYRGYLNQNLERFDKAVADYNKCIEVDPDYYLAYYNIGYINFYRNDIKTALHAFNECIVHNTTYTKAYYMRGLCYEKLKDKNKAEENYLFCLQIEPEFKEAKAGLARIESKKK